jgi:hypothetical protein
MAPRFEQYRTRPGVVVAATLVPGAGSHGDDAWEVVVRHPNGSHPFLGILIAKPEFEALFERVDEPVLEPTIAHVDQLVATMQTPEAKAASDRAFKRRAPTDVSDGVPIAHDHEPTPTTAEEITRDDGPTAKRGAKSGAKKRR